jgi:cation transport ATPase
VKWSEDVQSELLMTAEDEIQANIIESLLQVYGIPVRRKYKGNDTFSKIYMGLTTHGVELYVPKAALEEAKDIIKNETSSEEDLKEVECETAAEQAEQEKLREKYDEKRRVRAWIALLFFTPGILMAAAAAVYLIIRFFRQGVLLH